MLHRSAKVRPGQRVLIHGAAGGVGSALLQLGRVAELEMYGTCSSRGASAVSDLGAIPIDYKQHDFVEEIHRLTNDGVDAVFDPIGGNTFGIRERLFVEAAGSWPMVTLLHYVGRVGSKSAGSSQSPSWNSHLRSVYLWRVDSPWTKTGRALQHTMAQTVKNLHGLDKI
jgi:NADPH2:quinone reductase